MMTYAMAAARPGGSYMIRRIEIDVPAAGAGEVVIAHEAIGICLLYTSPSPRD